MASEGSLKDIKLEDIKLRNIASLAVPLGFVVVLIVFFIFGYKIMLGKINSMRSELSAAKKDEIILIEKKQLLSEIKDEVALFIDSSVVAVPEKNAALPMISQLKSAIDSRLLSLSNLDISSPSKAKRNINLNKVKMEFEVDGDLFQLIQLVKGLTDIAPISKIDKMEIAKSGEVAQASVSLSVYFAPYPTELPPLTEPLKELSSDEIEVLNRLSQLQRPSFIEVSPTGPTGRRSPFE